MTIKKKSNGTFSINLTSDEMKTLLDANLWSYQHFLRKKLVITNKELSEKLNMEEKTCLKVYSENMKKFSNMHDKLVELVESSY